MKLFPLILISNLYEERVIQARFRNAKRGNNLGHSTNWNSIIARVTASGQWFSCQWFLKFQKTYELSIREPRAESFMTIDRNINIPNDCLKLGLSNIYIVVVFSGQTGCNW